MTAFEWLSELTKLLKIEVVMVALNQSSPSPYPMVDCLCNFARGAGHTRTGSIQILDLDNPQTFKRLILRCAQDMTRVGDGVALAKFLAQGANDGIPDKLLTLLPTTRSAEEIGLGSLQQQHGLFCTYVVRRG